jgi:hypothetical protein
MLRPSRCLSTVMISLLACGCASPADEEPLGVASQGLATEGCTLSLHAILREQDATRITGQVQLRIRPAEDGGDPVITYDGALAPAGAKLGYEALEVEILPRVPDQSPTWSDAKKADPGTTLGASNLFGGASVMPSALARALAADPSAFKTVVQVVGTTGGREAEGVLSPRREAPAELRAQPRACF